MNVKMRKKNFVILVGLVLCIFLISIVMGATWEGDDSPRVIKDDPIYVTELPENLNDLTEAEILTGDEISEYRGEVQDIEKSKPFTTTLLLTIIGGSLLIVVIIILVIYMLSKNKKSSNTNQVTKALKTLFLIFLFIFLINFVSAENQAFRLSSATNAHLGNFTGSGYPAVTLNQEIVGVSYFPFYLSALDNAHAATSGYSVGINLGSAYYNCYLDTDSTCPAGEECILELSAATNAHAAACGQEVYDAFCCDYYSCGDGVITAAAEEQCEGSNLNGIDSCVAAYGAGFSGTLGCTNCKYSGCAAVGCGVVPPECTEGVEDLNKCDDDTKYDCTVNSETGCTAKTSIVDCTATNGVCIVGSGCAECSVVGDCIFTETPGAICYDPTDCHSGLKYCDSGGDSCQDHYPLAEPFFSSCTNKLCIKIIKPTCAPCPLGCNAGTKLCNVAAVCDAAACALTSYNTYSCTGALWEQTTHTKGCDPDCKVIGSATTASQTCSAPKPYCVATATRCVECTSPSHCGSATDTGNYQCDGTVFQKEVTNPTCVSNECGSATSWDPVEDCAASGKTCTASGCVGSLYWANMGGIKITEADLGDNVLMMYRDKGTEILSYELKEKDPLDNDDIRVIPSSETFNFDGDLAGFVKINQSDMDKAEAQTLDEDRSDDDREFIFVVDSKTLEDGDKLVIQEDVFSNALPTATIIAPVDDASYTLDYTGDKTTEEIIFNQSSSDEDDDIKVQWSFGDGTTSTWQENCLTTGSCDSVTHEYDSPGTKNVILIAQEMERGQWGWDSKNIFVYGVGLQVFSVIDNPIATGRFVTLNANQSKVTNCTNGTQPGPEWYEVLDAEGTGSSHPLWCYDLPKGDIGISYDFILKWTLDEADEDKKETIEGFWSDGYGDVVEFGHLFPDLGVHTIKLEIGYIKL